MADQTQCRRCSVCEGASHHWLDNPDFGNDQNPPSDAEPYNSEATHVCKHCDALGMECEACDGSGVDAGMELSGEDETCSECKGEGVILFSPHAGDQE